MYNYLSRAVKKRIMETLRFCFDASPRHRDVVKHIREKYDFSERPQKGIVLQSTSANPMSLSADNYIGTMYSYLMLAKVDDNRGTALEWVKEDDKAIEENGGTFPSDPGVYYIEIEETTVTGEVPTFQFWVDPLLTVLEEPIIEFVTGNETNAILANAPVVEGGERLYAYPDNLLVSGQALEFTADESLYLGGSDTSFLPGLEEGYVAPEAVGSAPPPPPTPPTYTFTSSNNTFAFQINGQSVTATLSTGNLTADDVATEIESAAIAAGVDSAFYGVDVESSAVKLTATETLFIEADTTSTANPVLGFTSGFVAPTVTGQLAQPYVPEGSTFRAVVDGTPEEIDLRFGNRDVDTYAQEIQTGFSATSLVVNTVDAGDYTIDYSTGQITFLHSFLPGTRIIADYRYPVASRGPYPLEGGDISNNEAIPGAVLAFGRELEDGDIQAVVVEEKRSQVADVYGGKVDMSLDFDIIARDSMTRGELADNVVMYLWQWRREHLADEGIILQNVSFGGESEEPYDDTGDDYYYLANISMSLMTDWEVYFAKPLFITRVTPYSYDQDARRVEQENGILQEGPENYQKQGENALEMFSQIYAVDPSGNFERLR